MEQSEQSYAVSPQKRPCWLKTDDVRGKRALKRHRDQALLDRARRQANTKRAKLDRKRRQHLVERSFADAANRHGFKRARWRGLVKQSIQDLLIATIQNLRKLIGTIRNLPRNAWNALTRIPWMSDLILRALHFTD